MEELREKLKKVILRLHGEALRADDVEFEVTAAPENVEADFSSNAAMKLAKTLHKNPMEVAEEIAEVMNKDEAGILQGEKEEAEIAIKNEDKEENGETNVFVARPGFLNFKIRNAELHDKFLKLFANFDEEIRLDDYEEKTVICEFSDPNPFKVLHVGHLYTSIVGDAISRLYENAGAKVIRANFGGDVGLHVAKTLYILKQKNLPEFTIDDIARCYVEGTAAYEDDEGARAEITALNKEIYKINSENIHEGELARLYWEGREISYEYFKEFYARIGVEFDRYYPESEVAKLGLDTVLRELQNGVYEKSQGAVVFNGEKYGLHTRVFVNREGVPTYEAKDVGLIFQKYEDFKFDRSVVITGAEQLEYMKVVLKSVEQYAPELVSKTSHLTHGLVKLQGNVKMSSRKGNFLRAVEVLEMVSRELSEQYQSQDEKVALAATKYAFLKYKMGGDIIFDPKESVNMTGNSGPYLLYSAVRAKKILKNARDDAKGDALNNGEDDAWGNGERDARNNGEGNVWNSEEKDAQNNNYKYNEYERKLILKLMQYKDVLITATEEIAPHKVATYLYETAQEFSRFYEKCPVVGAKEEGERIKIVKVYLETMLHGLGILGIEVPEEM